MPQDQITVTHNIQPQKLRQELDQLRTPKDDHPVLLDLKDTTELGKGHNKLCLSKATQGQGKTFGQKEASIKLLISRMDISDHAKAHIGTRLNQMRASDFTLTDFRDLLSEAIKQDKSTISLLKSRGIEPETISPKLAMIMEKLENQDTARNSIADVIKAIIHDVQPSGRSQEGLAKLMRAAIDPAGSRERLTDKQLANLAKVYLRNDGIRDNLFRIINDAKHPRAVADAAFALTGRDFLLQQCFKKDSNLVAEYSNNMLRMVGEAGGDSADRLKEFVESKLLLQNENNFGKKFNAESTQPSRKAFQIDTGVVHPVVYASQLRSVEEPHQSETSNERRFRAVNYVSQALLSLKTDTQRLNISKGKDALDEVMFRPRFNTVPATNEAATPTVTLATFSTALAAQMKKAIDYFDDKTGEGEKRQQKILDLRATKNATAQHLIKMSVGKTNSKAATNTETQRAVLNAMLTNIRQGNGPTCTATSQLILMARTDPTIILDKFIDIATDGLMKNTSDTLPPVHAVRNVVDDGDPLVRSLEATIMVGVARDNRSERSTDSEMVGALAATLFYPYNTKDPTSKPPEFKPIADAVSAKFDYMYDPTAYIEKDGKTEHGVYILCKKGTDPREKIQTRAEFIAAVQNAVMDADIQRLLPPKHKGGAAVETIMSASEYQTKTFDDWLQFALKNPGGAKTEDVATFMTNTKMQKDVLLAEKEGETMASEDWRDQKMPRMLASLIMRATKSGQNPGVFSSPKHALTYDVDHPTLSRVDKSAIDACEQSIRNILLNPPLTPADGAELAMTFEAKIKAEDPSFVLSQQDHNFCQSGVLLGDALARLEAVLPTITTNTLSILSSKVNNDEATTFVPDNIRRSFSSLKTECIDRFLDGNELVFADPNFGSEASERVWVLRRDPSTQKINIYEKSLDGSLTALKDETCRNGEWDTLRPEETKP